MKKHLAAGAAGGLATLIAVVLMATTAANFRLASGQVLVGNASNVARPVAISGDVTIDNTGNVQLSGAPVVSADIAANTIVSADIDQNVIQVANVQLTNAQVLAVRATGINVIAAPPANTANVVDLMEIVVNASAVAYTETADDLVLQYSGGVDIIPVDATPLVGAAVNVFYYYPIQVPVIAAGANTACSTTCVGSGSCLVGINQAAVGFVACADATADSCWCSGTGLVPTAAQAIEIRNIGDGEWGGGDGANTMSIRVWYHRVSTIAFSSGG